MQKVIDRLIMRPLGWNQTDIEINFECLYRPVLVSEILYCCAILENGKRPDKNFIWDLTVNKRIEYLYEIVTHEGIKNLDLQLRCQNEACEKLIEIQISQDDIRNIKPAQNPSKPMSIRIKGRTLNFRRPTGRDQLNWLGQAAVNDIVTPRTMLKTLFLKKETSKSDVDIENILTKQNIEKIDKKMREFDPLIDFNLTVLCPVCQKKCLYSLDLEQLLLEKLHKSQLALFFEIHRLATAYHWGEQEILSLGPIRRKKYLAFVDDEDIL